MTRFSFAILVIAVIALAFGLRQVQHSRLRAKAFNDLKGMGLLLAMYAGKHDGRLPDQLIEAVLAYGLTEKHMLDVGCGQPFVYVGAGKMWQANRDEILAYSPCAHRGGRSVLFGDGRGEWVRDHRFILMLDAQTNRVGHPD